MNTALEDSVRNSAFRVSCSFSHLVSLDLKTSNDFLVQSGLLP